MEHITTAEHQAERRQDLGELPLDRLADQYAGISIDKKTLFEAEFRRRETEAVVETAEYTRRSAKWMLLSVIALVLTNGALVTMQAVSTFYGARPSVDFDTESDPNGSIVGIQIENSGPGPAVIKRAPYYVDGKLVGDIMDLSKSGKLDSNLQGAYVFDKDQAFAAGEKTWLLSRPARGGKGIDQFRDFINEHLAVKVDYCTVWGFPCWSKCSTRGRC